MSLEELLKRLSEGLVVRRVNWELTPARTWACVYTYLDVSPEVRTQFEKELRRHIWENSNTNTTYSFGYWDDGDAGIVKGMLKANNLQVFFQS